MRAADVGAEVRALKMDVVHAGIGTLDGCVEGFTPGRDGKHAAATADQLTVFDPCASVENLSVG